jgi:hypothetical protein
MIDHAGVPTELAGEIAAEWDNRDSAVAKFEEFLAMMRPEHARRAWVRANNYRLQHELYLSQPTAAFAAELTAAIRRTFDIWTGQGGRNRQIDAALTEITAAMKQFRSLMQSELITPLGDSPRLSVAQAGDRGAHPSAV